MFYKRVQLNVKSSMLEANISKYVSNLYCTLTLKQPWKCALRIINLRSRNV